MGRRALPRLHWGAIAAGTLVALASHIVLGLIGAALGFAAEPADSEGVGAAAAIWGLLTPFVASLIGAWIATKMASAWDASASNLHGVLTWAIGLIAGALFLAGTMATGALSASNAASGNAGAARAMTRDLGRDPARATTPRAAEEQADEAGKRAAATAGGGAMAALAGLLGAFAGAALGRRREDARGLGWKAGLRRDEGRRDERREARQDVRYEDRRIEDRGGYGVGTGAYPQSGGTTGERLGPGESRIVTPNDPNRPDDPFHH